MKKYLILVDLGIRVRAKNIEHAEEIVKERIESSMQLSADPIEGISIHKITGEYDDIEDICEGCGEPILEEQSRVDNRHSICWK